MNAPQPIGLIGLGAMGRGMAASLRRAGYAVHVYDVRAEAAQAFTTEGGTACTSPADSASRCEIVISVVVNAAQTEDVLFGAQGAARRGLCDPHPLHAPGGAPAGRRLERRRHRAAQPRGGRAGGRPYHRDARGRHAAARGNAELRQQFGAIW